MKRFESAHLSEDELSDAALGEVLTTEAQTHLTSCAECRAQVDGFCLAVTDFQGAARAWSESRSAGMEPLRLGSKSPHTAGLGVLTPAYAWAAAGLLAVGVTVPIVQHISHGQQAPPQTAQVEEGDSPEQIARDNELMVEVDFELTRTDTAKTLTVFTDDRGGERP